MREITIPIPEGFKVESFDLQTGKMKLAPKPLDPVGRIETFEEVCAEAGVEPEDYETDSLDPKEIVLAQIWRIMLIVEVFNQGEEIRMDDPNQKKWRPWFDHTTESGFRFDDSDFSFANAGSVLGPLLSFKDQRTSDYVGKTFLQEFKKIHFPKSK